MQKNCSHCPQVEFSGLEIKENHQEIILVNREVGALA